VYIKIVITNLTKRKKMKIKKLPEFPPIRLFRSGILSL